MEYRKLLEEVRPSIRDAKESLSLSKSVGTPEEEITLLADVFRYLRDALDEIDDYDASRGLRPDHDILRILSKDPK